MALARVREHINPTDYSPGYDGLLDEIGVWLGFPHEGDRYLEKCESDPTKVIMMLKEKADGLGIEFDCGEWERITQRGWNQDEEI